jgi:hypothetical protein
MLQVVILEQSENTLLCSVSNLNYDKEAENKNLEQLSPSLKSTPNDSSVAFQQFLPISLVVHAITMQVPLRAQPTSK